MGRGNASGQGTTAGKGTKGEKARAGGIKAGFRGMSSRNFRLAKRRGFTNRFKVEYQPVNLNKLTEVEAGATVDVDWLKSQGLVRGKEPRVKILADGDVTVALHFVGVKVSGAARQKIESAGGSVDAGDAAESAPQPEARSSPAPAEAKTDAPASQAVRSPTRFVTPARRRPPPRRLRRNAPASPKRLNPRPSHR